MAHLRIDPLIAAHPVVYQVGDEALGLWLRIAGWLATFPTQGNFVPRRTVKRYGKRRQVTALVAAGMWVEVEGGYEVYRNLDLAGCGHARAMWSVEQTESRRKIPSDLRAAIYARDSHACVECSATDDLTLDHIFPWSKGGLDEYENLRTLCRPCNSRKGAKV